MAGQVEHMGTVRCGLPNPSMEWTGYAGRNAGQIVRSGCSDRKRRRMSRPLSSRPLGSQVDGLPGGMMINRGEIEQQSDP